MKTPIPADPPASAEPPAASLTEAAVPSNTTPQRLMTVSQEWSVSLPSGVEISAILRGFVEPPAQLAEWTRQFRSRLTDIEQDVLDEGTLGFDPKPFRDLLTARWLLRAVLETLPRKRTAADERFLDDVLDRATRVGTAVEVQKGLPPGDVQLAATRHVLALRTDASTLIARLSPQLPLDPPSMNEGEPSARAGDADASGKRHSRSGEETRDASKGKGAKPTHAKPTAPPGSSAQPSASFPSGAPLLSKRVVLVAGLAVAVLALVISFSTRPVSFIPHPTVEGAPAGLGVTELAGGSLMVRTADGNAPDDEVAAWLEAKVKAGFAVSPLSPGSFMLRPSKKRPAPSPSSGSPSR